MSTGSSRSTDPLDYQSLAQPVAAMGKGFPAGFQIAAHSHARDQMLYAVSGTMRIRTAQDAWVVPPDRAVYIPGGIVHGVTMRGPVEMRTLYIDIAGSPTAALPGSPVGLMVTPLLRALILALLDEPIVYAAGTRADRLAMLILDEIARARPSAMSIPMPQDRRLLKLCEALLDDPSLGITLDGWADQCGASRRTIARLFRSECRMTFTAWRQRVRFHGAIEALSRGVSVGEAARQQGYGSVSAFTAAFRRTFGVPPKAALATGAAMLRAPPRRQADETI